MIKLTLDQIARMCGGKLAAAASVQVTRVIIDSRNAAANTLFVAIKGAKNNGHDYVMQSLENGCVGAIVQRDCGLTDPRLIYVKNTTVALGKLAHSYRLMFNIPVVAITGSNGKTTVKEMLRSICDEEFGAQYVLATEGNLNNQWGVPLTILGLGHEHKIMLVEMGMNHSGELEYLTQIVKPTVAVVNNVMRAHIEFFSSLEDVARAKGEIYHGLGKDGIACVNMADEFNSLWLADISDRGNKTFKFGVTNSACYLDDVDIGDRVCILTKSGEISTKLNVLGEHNKKNALTASALALVVGCAPKSIARGLASYSGYKGRLERKVAFNGAVIIDDSYNANPDSVKAAILAIKNLPHPHWFIMGDLGELGKSSRALHKEVGKFAVENGIDVFLTIGELSRLAGESFGASSMHFKTHESIVKYCRDNSPASATILVKGSKPAKMGIVVDMLQSAD